MLSDRELAERFGAAAAERYREWHTTPAEYAAQVRGLVDASLRDAGAVPGEKPRVLIVRRRRSAVRGSTDATLRALRDELDYCVARAAPSAVSSRAGRRVGPGSRDPRATLAGPARLARVLRVAAVPDRVARRAASSQGS